jgi:pre-60S factor REI1
MEGQARGTSGSWGQEDHAAPETKTFLPAECLFCNQVSDGGVAGNMQHMYNQHGLFIPEPQNLADMITFILYLGRVVGQSQECLYCGLVKTTVQGVQQHMVDKGHCMLNFDRESELLEFWELSEGEAEEAEDTGVAGETSERRPNASSRGAEQPQRLSATELRLPSGAVVGARGERSRLSHARRRAPTADAETALLARPRSRAGGAEATPESSSAATDRRLVTTRREMGLVGLSDQQRKSLAVVEKKMQKQERVARAAHMWAREKVANRQKYYVVRFASQTLADFADHSSQTILVGRTADRIGIAREVNIVCLTLRPSMN